MERKKKSSLKYAYLFESSQLHSYDGGQHQSLRCEEVHTFNRKKKVRKVKYQDHTGEKKKQTTETFYINRAFLLD